MRASGAARHVSSTFGRAFIACISLAIAMAFCSGCQRSTVEGGGSSKSVEEEPAYPVEHYVGYWLCIGYEKGGATVSYSNLSAEEHEMFPFLVLELGKSGGELTQISNGDGEHRLLYMGECRASSAGIKLDNGEGAVEFHLDGEGLALLPEEASSIEDSISNLGLYPDTLPKGATYHFQRLALEGQPLVSTYVFDGISLDVPYDLAYVLNAKSPDHKDDGSVFVYGASPRPHGPGMDLYSAPDGAANIVEIIAEAEGQEYVQQHSDRFYEQSGVYYYVYYDEGGERTRLCFVANGKYYEISFEYDSEDGVDYTDYAKYFFTSISFANEVSSPASSASVPDGAISWQDASAHVGETVTVYGSVADVEYASESDGQPTFIDLGVAYPDTSRVTMVIWGEDRAAFPESPEAMYTGKTLCVTGEVYLYEGVCYIRVTSSSQVQVI